jgi:hypothetical protein
MLIHPWDAAIDSAEWQYWLAGGRAVISGDTATAMAFLLMDSVAEIARWASRDTPAAGTRPTAGPAWGLPGMLPRPGSSPACWRLAVQFAGRDRRARSAASALPWLVRALGGHPGCDAGAGSAGEVPGRGRAGAVASCSQIGWYGPACGRMT